MFAIPKSVIKVVETASRLVERPFNTDETSVLLKANLPMYWSWGVSKTYTVENYSGLLLKVSGRYHRGWVLVVLDWDDTYTVHYLSSTGKLKEGTSEYGVYFDYLANTIDCFIETRD